MNWEMARCKSADPELFFLVKGGDAIIDKKKAKRVCNQCRIQQECLDYAIENNERFGIWGGKTRKERLRYKQVKEQLRSR